MFLNSLKMLNFRNYSMIFNFCVHIRRGDFIELGQASEKNYTEAAMALILEQLKVDNLSTFNNVISQYR